MQWQNLEQRIQYH